MASVNKVILIGNITRDPETRYLASGDAVTSASIACNETWKDKNGEKQERVEYVNLVFFRKLAEIVSQYCHKGQSIYVEGKLQTDKYTDKQGVEKYSTKVVADKMQMLGGKGDSQAQRPQQGKPSGAQKTNDDFPESAGDLDDIPF